MSDQYIIGVDPAAGGSLTVFSFIGEGSNDDGFIPNSPILSYVWDLTGFHLLKGEDDEGKTGSTGDGTTTG